MLKKIVKWLDGKKSYIAVGLIFALGGVKSLQSAGYLPEFPESVWEFVFTLLGAFGLFSVRDAIRKAEK